MIVYDANLLIGFFTPGDDQHDVAVAHFENVEEPGLLAPLTLAEILVQPARAGREQIVADKIAALGIDVAETDEQWPLRLARARAASGLKMPDAVVLEAAQHLGAAVGTTDDRLRAAALRAKLTVLPPDPDSEPST